jgi:hypothetical protein
MCIGELGRCSHCEAVGCNGNGCPNQNFDYHGGRCLKCGATSAFTEV